MKKTLLAIFLSIGVLGFSQTFDNIPTGKGYYINKLIASPSGSDLTREYLELRGPAGELVPEDLYFITIEGDGEDGSDNLPKTNIGRVQDVLKLGNGTRTFGANGILVVVSNYTDINGASGHELDPLDLDDANENVKTFNEYEAHISSEATVIVVELEGRDVTQSGSSAVTASLGDVGYDGNLIDPGATYMLISSASSPSGVDLDSDTNNDDTDNGVDNFQDGIIDTIGDHTAWTLFDSVSYCDDDDWTSKNADHFGEFAYGQIVFAQGYSTDQTGAGIAEDNSADFNITTSATIINMDTTSDLSYYFRQGTKTGSSDNDWVGAANGSTSYPLWNLTGTSGNGVKINRDYFKGFSFETDVFYGDLNPVEPNTWTGTTSSDWTNPSNWDLGIVPGEGSVVSIESASNNPVVSFGFGAEAYSVEVATDASLTIENFGSLILGGSSTGDITYNVNASAANFHLVASPLVGETYDDMWVTDNEIASGTVSAANKGIATYSNTSLTDTWSYYQDGGVAENFNTGVGYALIRTGAGDYSFTGAYPELPTSIAVTQGVSNWNLVGNTSPAYLNVADLITENVNNISPEYQAVYVYDGSEYSEMTSGQLSPGQGYFVNVNTGTTELLVTEGMLSHVETIAEGGFNKSSESIVLLNISNGTVSKSTALIYSDDATLGLDPGKDLGLFNGVSSDLNIYTELVSDSNGIAFGKQTLPDTGAVVPVGVIAKSGEEIVFSLDVVGVDVTFYLEDKLSGTFVNISEGEYKTTLDSDVNGIGRFYVHTVAKTLSNEDVFNDLEGVSVYESNGQLTVLGINSEMTVNVYSLLGTEVLSTVIESDGNTSIALPTLSTGVYIVKLESDSGKITKKIILD